MANPLALYGRTHSQPPILTAQGHALQSPHPPTPRWSSASRGVLFPQCSEGLFLPTLLRVFGSELTSQRRRTPLGSSRSPGSGRLPGGSASSESLPPAAGRSGLSTTCREGKVRVGGRPRCPVPGTNHRQVPPAVLDTGGAPAPGLQTGNLRPREAEVMYPRSHIVADRSCA